MPDSTLPAPSIVTVYPDMLPEARRRARLRLGAQREWRVGDAAWWSVPVQPPAPPR